MLRLIMRRGPTPGAVYELEGDEITIGRGNKNTIVIRDNEVSRDHCRLVRLMGNYELHDLNSSNGTFINGQHVTAPWLLQTGAVIELGDTITLEYGPQEIDPQPQADGEAVSVEESVRFNLLMIKGPTVGSIYPLNGKTIAIGRDVTNDIAIQDPEVSRYHARLHFSQRGYLVEDLRSTNGTFINGEPVREDHCLEPNDVLKLGTMVQLQYVFREVGANNEDDTPLSRPSELEYDNDTVFTNFFKAEPSHRAASARSTGLEPDALRDHLMIVYAREDWEPLVAPLLVRLQDTRLSAWVDQYLAPGSDDWRAAVEQALTECWLLVLVVSPEALRSNVTKMMYRYFLHENKPVLALIRDTSAPLPGELNHLRSIVYDPENNPRSFHKLIFEIMQLHQPS